MKLLQTVLFIFFLVIITQRNFAQNKVVYIQPLGKVKKEYINQAKTSIETFFGVKCVIKKEVPLSDNLFSKSKTRYSALSILKKFQSKENILIITEKDIVSKKGKNEEWGILGLGYRPGTVCVVSTFRMKKDVNEEKILERLKKVSIHEVGHNLGLDHCTNDIKCMMNDAKGTIRQIDREDFYFCKKCKNQINLK
jgi:archaemetzincin